MPFSSFNRQDFKLMKKVKFKEPIQSKLENKINDLRFELGSFPEYELDFFRKRIVRREMRGKDGIVFGEARSYDQHWFLYTVGGDQDQIQLNIGMYPSYIRVGIGFQIGRQVNPKIPAFHLFQTFLGIRPPIPFRDAFFESIKRNKWRIESNPKLTDPNSIIHHLETYVVPADNEPIFVFVGALWNVEESAKKRIDDYRQVFLELMPFYEELIIAGGRYKFFQ